MERIEKLNELTGDLMQVDKLKRDVAMQHLLVVSQEKALAESKEKLEAAKLLLNSTLDRIDAAFLLLYQGAQPVQVEEPKRTRGKRAADAAPEASVEVREKFPCPKCDDVYYSESALRGHLFNAHRMTYDTMDGAGDTPLTDDPPELPLCATCIGPCNKFEDHSFEQAFHCGGFTIEPNEDQVKWRDSTCQEWRNCQFQNKCFGPANEYDPTCFKEDEIRRRGEASLAAESKSSTVPKVDTEARRAQLIEEKARRDGLCGEWLGCDLHQECFKQEQHACLKKAEQPATFPHICDYCRAAHPGCTDCCDTCKTACQSIQGCRMEEAREQWEALETPKPNYETFIVEYQVKAGLTYPIGEAAQESDEDVLSRHEPAELILPRGEFRLEDLPKGKKKQLALLEERRKAVADLVARRIDYFKRGSAAVSDYDKSLGYDLDYNLTMNKTQLSYALSQFNGLNELLNPTSEQETNHEAVAQEAGPESNEAEQESAGTVVPGGPATPTFQPLDEPLGDCELCMGYGVIEGELYGKSTLVPCTCHAGLKVNGGDVTPECCKKCNIADPDCANCQLPDSAAVPTPPPAGEGELPRCANGSCTATGKNAKEVCLRIGQLGRPPQDCKNFVPVEKCSHHMMKRSTAPNGSTVCDLCGFVLREAPKAEPEKCGNTRCNMYGSAFNSNCRAIEDLLQTSGEQRQASACNDYKPLNLANHEPAQPELTTMQKKCTHPKVFRELTEAGEICKVCKLNLTQPALFS